MGLVATVLGRVAALAAFLAAFFAAISSAEGLPPLGPFCCLSFLFCHDCLSIRARSRSRR